MERIVSDLFSKLDSMPTQQLKYIARSINNYYECRVLEDQRKEQLRIRQEKNRDQLDMEDVALVMKQVEGITEEQAKDALISNDNDFVDTIMSLTGV